MLNQKKFEVIFFIILILYCFYCISQLGRTWDTLFHYELGKDRLDYLFSLGTNKVDDSISSKKFYPGAYNTILAFLLQLFPRNFLVESIFLINLIFSILTAYGISKVSEELFNKEIGKITFLVCLFNPVFFGHMAINSVDTIVAFSYVWFFFLILKYLKNNQSKEKRDNYVILSGLCLGLGVGTRSSFVIILFPIFLFLLLEIFYLRIFIKKKFNKKVFFLDSFKVLAISYLFMVFFWPQTHENIFLLPFKLAVESFSFGFGVPLILFNGQTVLTETLPKSYIFVNLFYKMPEFIVISFLVFITFFFQIASNFKKLIRGFNFKIFLILIIILFPSILMFLNPYGFYDGLRLILYIIPFIAIIPSILIYYFFKNIKKKINKIFFYFLVSLKIFLVINFFAMTPYHYVYLNIFAGKYSNNEKKFENDYWGVSTKKLITKFKVKEEKEKIRIATCGVPPNAQEDYLKNNQDLKFKMVNKNEDFDYIIMNNRIVRDLGKELSNPEKNVTCFEKYTGTDVAKVKRRGLTLSKITKKN